MKMRKISILLAVAVGAVLTFTGCSKDDGAVPKRVGIEAVPAISTAIDASGSQSINMLNLAAFAGKFTVSQYFPGTAAPTKVDIVVRKNGSNANVKMYKAGVTTFPTSYTVTAAELVTLFGAPIALGDTYDFAPDLYVGDKKYDAFPAIGLGSGAGLALMPLFSEFARFGAICAYDPLIYQGNFVVVTDGWADYTPGSVINLIQASPNSFYFLHKETVNPKPFLITVNTGNNQAVVARTSLGTAWTYYVGTYTGAFATTTNNAASASFVSPCDKTVTLALTYGVDAGNFSGVMMLVLRKQ